MSLTPEPPDAASGGDHGGLGPEPLFVPYGHQTIDESDIAVVLEVLQGDWLTQGPALERFEAALCEATEATDAIAFTSGTAALHAAAAAGGLGPGDVVATSPLTFSASAACARYVGATPTLVDLNPETLNLDTTKVSADLDALVAVHYAGLPMDMRGLSHRPRIVIEDACHALGATTPDGPVGNCAHSDMACFSFHPVKPITTGEGGAVTTNDPELAAALRRFRNHGIERLPERDSWYYEVQSLGYNYRLNEIGAALGVNQLTKLATMINRRNDIAERYRSGLAELPLRLPPTAPAGFTHGYHLFTIQVDERRQVFEQLRAAGLGVQVHYVPIHHHPAYKDLGFGPGDLPEADAAYERLISLPIFPGLGDAEVDRVIETLESILT